MASEGCKEKLRHAAKVKEEESSTDAAWDLIAVLSQKVECESWAVRNVVELLDNDNTIPFIARYRKEKTGGMEPEKIREVKDELDGLRAVQNKIVNVIKSLTKDGKLTQDVERALRHSQTLAEVEHLYAPFKPGSKKSLAERAKAAGLEPVAYNLLRNPSQVDFAAAVDPNSKDASILSDVIKGVQHIVADLISKDKDVMDVARSSFATANIQLETCKSRSLDKKLTKDEHEDKSAFEAKKFENYFDFHIPVKYVKPHQVLAINRGENLKILSVKLTVPDHLKYTIEKEASKKYMHPQLSENLRNIVKEAIQDAYTRLIQPLMLRQIRKELSKKAEKASVDVFAANLKRLLLIPPVRGKVVLGFDPGFRNGCKYAITSLTGSVLATGIAYLHGCHQSKQSSEISKLAAAMKKHRCETVAIGNGTACRESEQLFSNHIKAGTFRPLNVVYCIVNEAGASIYSASDEAKKEMPDLDVSLRGAVSIARRLQDPLAELVKIDPKHIGVGMYQHDVPETQLRSALGDVVEECVSFVGVDLNVCTEVILRRIAGLSQSKAQKIIAWRESNGPFINREQLKEVKGLGPKSFEQCVGFVRILPETSSAPDTRKLNSDEAEPEVKAGGKRKAAKTSQPAAKKSKKNFVYDPLDQTNIHPESYPAAGRLIAKLGLNKECIGKPSFIQHFAKYKNPSALESLAKEFGTGVPTMSLILEGLQQPIGHDYRDEFEKPLFRQGMMSSSDLKVGMKLTGRVTNCTHFGAFVDVGVGIDGLVHTSHMPAVDHRGPGALELGDKVEVEVLSLELQRKRIGLHLLRML